MTLDEAIKELLGEPISNTSQHMFDDFVKTNADFRAKAGLKETIERVETGKCCEWCSRLAGTYPYPEGTPKDVFRRHKRCKCIVTHHSTKGVVQDVHTKGFLSQKSIDELERMKKVGLDDKPIKVAAESGLRTKNSDYAVQWATIKSKEYTERFNVLSKNEKANALAAKRARNLLVDRDTLNSEGLYAISLTTGKNISEITNQYHPFGVVRTQKFDSDVNRAEENGSRVLIIHNHPNGSPPSRVDLNELLLHDNACGLIVGHDGSLYYYTKPSRNISRFEYYVASSKIKGYNGIARTEKTIEELSRQLDFVFKKI